MVMNYPNAWVTRSYLAQSAHKSNKIYNKLKIFDFYFPYIPFCNFQNSVSEKMWCCLTFVCVYSYIVLMITTCLFLELSVFGLYYILILSCLSVTFFVESVKHFNECYNAYPSYLLVHIIHANPSYILVHILYMHILLIY